jgi:hypothetical protein
VSGATLARSGGSDVGAAAGPRLSNAMASLAAVLWLVSLAVGFGLLWRYKSTPGGGPERPPAEWPAESGIFRNSGGATLLMFVHPRCPCTHASISELARLLARAPVRLQTHVIVAEPAGVAAGWTDTELVRRAHGIPGVDVFRDEAGREAARFHAVVSGLAVLYDATGRRLFSGGITASRGHEGDSFGQERLLAVLSGRHADRDESPVFGCALGAGPASAVNRGT